MNSFDTGENDSGENPNCLIEILVVYKKVIQEA
jgi:hypothetical protein